MHAFRFMVSQQLRGTGKTTYQLQKCIRAGSGEERTNPVRSFAENTPVTV